MKESTVSLVLPTRDDTHHLRSLILAAKSECPEIEVIVVNSGSTPANTHLILTDLANLRRSEINCQLVSSQQGLGAALECGFRMASGRRIMWFPTDGQISIDVLRELIRKSNDRTFLYVARRNYLTTTTHARNVLSKVDKLIVRLLLGVDELDFSGVYSVPHWIYHSLSFRYRTAAINWSILHLSKTNRLRIARVEAGIINRSDGKSRISRREIIRYPLELIRYSLCRTSKVVT